MLKKTTIWLDTILAIILALLLGGLLAAYGWISLKPRDMTRHIPAILHEIDADFLKQGFKIQTDKALLKGGGFESPLTLSIENLTLQNPSGQILLNIPELSVTPSFIALFQGKIFPRSIEISGADFAILQDAAGAFYLDTKEQVAPMRLNDLFFTADPQKTPTKAEEFNLEHLFELGVDRIHVADAAVRFKSEMTGLDLTFPQLSANIHSVLLSKQVRGYLSASHLNTLGKPALLQASFDYQHNQKQLASDIRASEITLPQYARLHPELEFLKKIALPVSGKIHSTLQLPSTIQNITFDMQSPKLANLTLTGNVSGTFDDPTLKAQIATDSFDANFLKNHWPEGIGADAYRWIDQSIIGATVKKAEAEIHLNKNMLEQAVLPKDAVNMVLHIKDAEIAYTPGFPHTKRTNGRVFFEGQSLRAEIDSTRMLSDTKLKANAHYQKGRLLIPDLMQDNIRILLDLPLSASMRDVVKFIESTPYKLPPSLPLKAQKMKGALQGTLSMQIIDQITPIEDEVDFQLEAQLKKLRYKGLTQDTDLSNLSGSLSANNHGVKLDAKGAFNGKKFSTRLEATPDKEHYRFDGHLPISILRLAGIDIPAHLSGAIQAQARLDQPSSGSRKRFNATINTTALAYGFSELPIRKNIGQKGSLTVKGKRQKNRLTLDSFAFNDASVKAIGSATIDLKNGDILASQFKELMLGETKLSGDYAYKASQHHVTLTGAYLDAEKLMSDQDKESDKSLFQYLADIPNVVADISLKTISFGPDRVLNNATLKANCLGGRCEALNLRFHNGDTPFTARIESKDGKRHFIANTPDLGRILRVTGAFGDLRNGALEVNAIYKDELPNRPMAGRVSLKDFNIRNVPVLAKLLTVATFTGILDSLSGGGLSFQNMVIPFQYDTQKLIIQEAKAVGPSVGITANGELDIKPNKLQIEGTVIPAKLLDTVLSNIPILGNVYDAITGGEGLLAMNYKMRGNADDPEISVNPLSVLTPGFLRGFFDIFDKPDKQDRKDANEAKENLKSVEKELDAMENHPSEADTDSKQKE